MSPGSVRNPPRVKIVTIETPTVPDLPASNMSEVEDLVQFLSDRLDEKEAVARAAISGQIDPENGWGLEPSPTTGGFTLTPHVGHIHERAQGEHITRWHPARVLAECAAHRQIIAENVGGMRRKNKAPDHFISWSSSDPGPYVTLTGFLGPDISLNAGDSAEFINHYYEPLPPNRTLKALALPDAGHPDFNEAWRV